MCWCAGAAGAADGCCYLLYEKKRQSNKRSDKTQFKE